LNMPLGSRGKTARAVYLLCAAWTLKGEMHKECSRVRDAGGHINTPLQSTFHFRQRRASEHSLQVFARKACIKRPPLSRLRFPALPNQRRVRLTARLRLHRSADPPDVTPLKVNSA